ncbi:MAG: hypothetical protein AB8G23_18285 [Myxococcota bacterium]
MAIWLFLAALIALSGLCFFFGRAFRTPFAWLAIATGVSVFAIRLIQPGDYAMPGGGNLLAALLALGLGGLLLFLPRLEKSETETSSPAVWAQRLLLAAAPVVLFLALYSTLAELEEVVVLHSTHQAGHAVDLRLWIVDENGAGWIQMPQGKAEAHQLDVASELRMTRQGKPACVAVHPFSDLENTRRVQNLRYEKYLVQRLATLIGLFPTEPTGKAVVLRISDCPAQP